MVEFLNELDHEQFFQTSSFNNEAFITYPLPYSSDRLFINRDLS